MSNIPLDAHGQPVAKGLNAGRRNRRDIDQLIGMCRAVAMDGKVTTDEALLLDTWLKQNREVTDFWPACVVCDRLEEIFRDGFMDAEESRDLLELLQSLIGNFQTTDNAPTPATALCFDQPQPDLVFAGRTFLFTGKFYYGQRKRCQTVTESQGGLIAGSVNRSVNYLIVGGIGSRDWAHGIFGTKIESAIELRKKGYPIAIVHEAHWTTQLASNSS